MTAATYTCSVFDNMPKAVHAGDQTVGGKITLGAISVTDVIFLAKVPHGARIVEFREYHSNGQTAAVLDFGFTRGIAAGGAGNLSCLISGGALATMNRMSYAASPSGGPIQISLSDADPVRYTALAALAVSGTFTISVSLAWSLTYRMDGPDPV